MVCSGRTRRTGSFRTPVAAHRRCSGRGGLVASFARWHCLWRRTRGLHRRSDCLRRCAGIGPGRRSAACPGVDARSVGTVGLAHAFDAQLQLSLQLSLQLTSSRVLMPECTRYTSLHTCGRKDSWKEVLAPAVLPPAEVALPMPDRSAWWASEAALRPILHSHHNLRSIASMPSAAPDARAIGELAQPRFVAGEGVAAADARPLYVRHRVALTTAERAAGARL